MVENDRLSLKESSIRFAKDYQAKFCDVINIVSMLEGEASLKDPESNPYQSMYASRSMIRTLANAINLVNMSEQEEKLLVYLFINLRLLNNFLDTEETSEARLLAKEIYEKLLKESSIPITQIIKEERISDCELASLYGGQLAILFALLGLSHSPSDPEAEEEKQSTYWLNKALHITENLLKDNYEPYFYDSFLFNENILPFFQHFTENHACSIEKITLVNLMAKLLYMTAQAFLNSGNRSHSAVLLQKTISQVLISEEINLKFEQDLKKNNELFRITNPIFFVNINHLKKISLANNAASLAVYFTNSNKFYESADCLLSATELLFSSLETEAEYEETKASICRVFVDHLFGQFRTSLRDVESTTVPVQKRFVDNSSSLFKLQFKKSLEFWKISSPNILTTNPKDLNEAQKLFNMIEFGINEAENFFIYDGKCTDYVLLEKMRADSFMFLANFEDNPKAKSVLHKKRINIYTKFLEELKSSHLEDLRIGIQFNLAEAYFDQRDSKEEESRVPENKNRIAEILNKAAKICILSLESYQKFFTIYSERSLERYKIDVKKDKVKEPSDAKMLIQALIRMAQLHTLLSTRFHQPNNGSSGLVKGLECYKMAISLADINERYEKTLNGKREYMETEVQLADEMIELLSLRIKDMTV